MTTRVVRTGQTLPLDDDWLACSVEERLAGVWELTKLCLAWSKGTSHEPRLQRSVGNVQRVRR